MNNVLVAFNSRPDDAACSFFQGCADEARQICFDLRIPITSKTGEGFTEQNIMDAMSSHSFCIFAAHGSPDSIVNENGDEVISIRTTNYALKGKGLYAISCSCGLCLMPELRRIGIEMFTGYKDDFMFSGDESVFVNCALSGFRSFLQGNSLDQVKNDMYAAFDEAIQNAENSEDVFIKMYLLHDKEALVFHGSPDLTFATLI